MDPKNRDSKILDWLKQMSKSMHSIQHTVEGLEGRFDDLDRKLNLRMDLHDERIDALSEAIQALLKGMKSLRAQQMADRTKFEKEIQKIKHDIRELMH